MQEYVGAGGLITLRLGDYRDVLGDVEADAVITDTPYSERTHKGFRSSNDVEKYTGGTNRVSQAKRNGSRVGGSMPRTRFELAYNPIDSVWVAEATAFWGGRIRDWFVAFGDHISARWWEDYWTSERWVTFAPVPWIRTDSAPRFAADGPANCAEHIFVARPKGRVRDRCSRPGWYMGSIHGEKIVTGGKPLWLMRALVRDYSRPGDLVCDPCAGGATTLIAAAMEGRRAIGAELDPKTFELACKRIERTAISPPLFQDEAPKMTQEKLW